MGRRVIAWTIALAVVAAGIAFLATGERESREAPERGTPTTESTPPTVDAAVADPSAPPPPSPAGEPAPRVPAENRARSGRIAGRVSDAQDEPIAGATVRVAADPAGEAADLEPRTLSTDAEGAFRVDGLGPGPFILVAKAEGRRAAILRDVRPGAEEIEIVLRAQTGVAGRVLEAGTGAPVIRFTVQQVLGLPAGEGVARLGTPRRSFESPDGAFTISDLGAGRIELEFVAPGFVPSKIEVEGLREGEVRRGLEVGLRRGFAVRGSVVDGTSGDPVARAHVYFAPPDKPGRIAAAERTGADGSFVLEGFGRGARLRVRHEEFADASTEPLGLAGEEGVSGLVIRLSRGGGVDGYAMAPDGSPFAGGEAQVWLDEFISDTGVPFQRNASIDKSGYFVIRGLAAGEYRLHAYPAQKLFEDPGKWVDRGLDATVVVVEGKTTRVEFPAPPTGGCTVHGKVLRGDEPVRGARVRIEPQDEDGLLIRSGQYFILSARTGKDGSYAIDHVPPCEATIEAEREEGGVLEVGWSSLQVPASGQLAVDLRLPASEIRGTVTRASDRAPIPEAHVYVSLRETGRRRSRRGFGLNCDARGRYRVRGLEPGTYRVSVSPPSDDLDPTPVERTFASLAPQEREPIEVRPGEVVTADFALETGATVLARVFDPSGAPLPGEEVSLDPQWGEDGRMGSAYEGVTDGAGIARIPGVVPGRYSASLERREYGSQSSPVVTVAGAGEVEVRFELKEAFALRIRVLGPDGAPVREAEGSLEGEGGSGHGWRSRSEEDAGILTAYVVAGEYALRVGAEGFAWSTASVRVGPESPKEVVVRLERETEPK